MIDDQSGLLEESQPDIEEPGISAELLTESHRSGFHVRPIPIDQSFENS